MKRALVVYAIEQGLIDQGGHEIFELVLDCLKNKFNCNVSECYNHPNYLITILNTINVKKRKEIIKSITEKLKEFEYQEPIGKFIKSIII